MASLGGFAKRMRQYADNVDNNRSKVVRTIALAADQAIVTATPVDTGAARSNWNVGIDGPDSTVREAYSPGENGSTAAENTAQAIAAGKAVIAQFDKKKGHLSIWISNALPYIERLNEGWSAQAPAKYVESAVEAANRAARKLRILK